MPLQKRQKRTMGFAAGLLILSLATVLMSRLSSRGSRPGGDGDRDKTLMGHTFPVQALAFGADGTTLNSVACAPGRPQTVEVATWDVGTGHLVTKRVEHLGALRSLAIAPDGQRLAAVVEDREVVLWDVAPWRERARLAVPGLFGYTIALSADEAQLATPDFEHGITVWDVANGCVKSSYKVQVVGSLAFARDGTLLACGASDFNAGDCNVWLWNTATGEEIGPLRGHTRAVFALAFSPDGRLLASSEYNGVIKLWDVATQTLRATLTVAGDETVALVFSPDSGTLAVAVDRAVQLWDVATGQRLARLEGHEGKLTCLAFSPDGTRLASGGYDSTVRLWDVTRRR
jgi:WD40 repeat protein